MSEQQPYRTAAENIPLPKYSPSWETLAVVGVYKEDLEMVLDMVKSHPPSALLKLEDIKKKCQYNRFDLFDRGMNEEERKQIMKWIMELTIDQIKFLFAPSMKEVKREWEQHKATREQHKATRQANIWSELYYWIVR